ncbi:MAG: aromatic ring-hydroxylating dioxygenase subunit alpha [Saprospiraceae bacterium]|nr:aromatic ring-hydroxylating dioxygenase subunit alpha [Saprospiraceae bacterium]
MNDSTLSNLVDQYVSGYSLPQPFYTDQGVFEKDWELIWSKNWLYAGTAASIPKPGDYFVYEIKNESTIIIRDNDMTIHAHYNTCTHRGSIICSQAKGNTQKLSCPYHNWVFDKDGSLFKARLMPEEFDRSEYHLRPAHIANVDGFIFICLAKTAPEVSTIKNDFGPFLKPFNIHSAKVAHSATYHLRTNWKLIGENFRECYHCGPVHPEYCSAVIGANMFESAEPELAIKRPLWQSKGLETETVDFKENTNHFAVRYPLRPGVKSYSTDGNTISIPMGDHQDHDAGVVGLVVYPNFWMDAVSDYMWTMRLTPIDASHTIIDIEWLVDGKAVEGKDYTLDRLVQFWKITGEQDWILCENNFKGIESSRYKPGIYAPGEVDVKRYDDWYITTLRNSLNIQDRVAAALNDLFT